MDLENQEIGPVYIFGREPLWLPQYVPIFPSCVQFCKFFAVFSRASDGTAGNPVGSMSLAQILAS